MNARLGQALIERDLVGLADNPSYGLKGSWLDELRYRRLDQIAKDSPALKQALVAHRRGLKDPDVRALGEVHALHETGLPPDLFEDLIGYLGGRRGGTSRFWLLDNVARAKEAPIREAVARAIPDLLASRDADDYWSAMSILMETAHAQDPRVVDSALKRCQRPSALSEEAARTVAHRILSTEHLAAWGKSDRFRPALEKALAAAGGDGIRPHRGRCSPTAYGSSEYVTELTDWST